MLLPALLALLPVRARADAFEAFVEAAVPAFRPVRPCFRVRRTVELAVAGSGAFVLYRASEGGPAPAGLVPGRPRVRVTRHGGRDVRATVSLEPRPPKDCRSGPVRPIPADAPGAILLP